MAGRWVKRFPDGSEHDPNCHCSRCMSRETSKNVFVTNRRSDRIFYDQFPTLKEHPPGCGCRECVLKKRYGK